MDLDFLYKPTETMRIGLDFRSGSDIDFSGTATTTAPAAVSSLLPSGAISAPLSLPYNATIGVALMPSEELTVSADSNTLDGQATIRWKLL